MIKRYIITALVLIVLAPLNAGAAAWMTQSPTVGDTGEMPMAQMDMAGHDHESMMSSGQKQLMMDAHDHGSDDCDDYCMNCSNHCSSTAILSSSNDIFELDREFHKTLAGDTSNRAYLLFRPPIRA
ncbi:MAG: hypothetical protein COB20_09310 [SAR86 cluster bacterium]|uniref:DUF2946 domain-containing protein n=1 Tax=SAR86 cluster bacterium TaxID=2030880 RepID=A0A2A4X4F0_9GAMM|nr:MAG: hypothetical protein COB20_09310 [SAR86 cluster bacterium]